MTGLWMLTAAVCAAEAMWLKQWRPVRVPADLAPAGRVRELPLPRLWLRGFVPFRFRVLARGPSSSALAEASGFLAPQRLRKSSAIR